MEAGRAPQLASFQQLRGLVRFLAHAPAVGVAGARDGRPPGPALPLARRRHATLGKVKELGV